MTRSLRPRRGADDGVSLPELIISMTILSFIMGAIVFALVVALKNAEANADRQNGAGGAQLLAAWFTSDVQSADAVAGTTTAPAAVTPCGAEATTNVVLLRSATGPADAVSYRLDADGTDEAGRPLHRLLRVACAGGQRRQQTVAFGIPDPPDVRLCMDGVCPAVGADDNPIDGDDPIGTLRLELTVGRRDPSPVAVEGTPRTHVGDDALATCALVTATPQTVVVRGGALTGTVTFRLATTSTCTGTLALSLPTGTTTLAPALSGGPASWTATVAPAAATWTVGTRTATVTHDGAPVGTFAVRAVAEPCSFASLTPTTMLIGPDRRPAGPTTLTVTTAGPCSSPSLSIATNDSPATVTVPLTPAGPANSWQGSISPAAATWNLGVSAVVVRSGATAVGTAELNIGKLPCALVGASPLAGNTDFEAKLVGNLPMTVTTSGWCDPPMELRFDTGATPNPLVLPLTGGPFTWTTTVPRRLPDTTNVTWSEGDHQVALSSNGQEIGTATFTTKRQCTRTTTPQISLVVDGSGRVAFDSALGLATVGDCTAVWLDVPTGGSAGTLRINLAGGPPDWFGEVRRSDTTWSPGLHTATVSGTSQIGGTVGLGTVDIMVLTPACYVTDADDRIEVWRGLNKVRFGEPITFETSGPCGPVMTVRFSAPGGPAMSEAANQFQPNRWTTRDLAGTDWIEDETAVVSVYNSTTTFDATTLAGVFTVTAR
jgi:hypothetical protein